MAVEMMDKPLQDTMDFEKWDASQVADYFDKEGYGEYRSMFLDNQLTGDRVVLITAEDVPDLNMEIIGDRVGFLKALRALKTQARLKLRKIEIARYEEAYDGNIIGEQLCTCFGICPRDPDQYILKSSTIQIKEYELTRICGSFKCVCLGGEWHNDNITLDKIKDVDTVLTSTGCGPCRVSKCKVLLAVAAGADAESEEARVVQKELFVEGDIGPDFADRILVQAEEYVLMMRGTT